MSTIKVKYNKAKSQLLNKSCGFASLQVLLSTLFLLLLFSACVNKKDDNLQLLKPLEIYDVNLPETSDLCFDSNTGLLYTVSDNTCKVYKITTKGRVLSALSYTGFDLEGVTLDDNQSVYAAEERLRKILILDLQGNVIGKKEIPVEKNEENEGLEGISYASFNQHFYIINEMNPGILIETENNLNVLAYYPLTFADDYSGICVDNTNQNLWIVSDMSATVNKCDMKGNLIESFRIPVNNAEGIAIDFQSMKMYIISDSESKLYIFKLNNQ